MTKSIERLDIKKKFRITCHRIKNKKVGARDRKRANESEKKRGKRYSEEKKFKEPSHNSVFN